MLEIVKEEEPWIIKSLRSVLMKKEMGRISVQRWIYDWIER